MSVCNDFSEISVLIPGYSIEDLPTDLPEDGASSLLNAVACAWHPRLLSRSTSIPLFRQAESLSGYPGRRIILVPSASESWMPHEWRSALRDQGHIVISACITRDEWLTAINRALNDESPAVSPVTSETKADPDLLPHFLSLGTVLLQTQLLSRRRHHFVDPDNILIGREVRLAADAFLNGDCETAKAHLGKCFEHVRETRERFHPMSCYLVDICIPGDDEAPETIIELLQSPTKLNLFATGRDLVRWISGNSQIADALSSALKNERIGLLSGHDHETRTSLGSMATTVADIQRCRALFTKTLGHTPRHWARRRFGLTASMPALLSHLGFESAFHVALDDGLYPDRERSQFEWQAPDGSMIAAASRIPLAIDSAAGFLRFADRYNESMQDDSTAALFLARLPTLKSPWMTDLQIAATYAPVLGEFVTMDQLCHAAGGTRLAERHDHSDYLAPFLIQSSVLKTEPPISGPATLRLLNQQLESLRTAHGIAGLIRTTEGMTESARRMSELEAAIADLELQHVDVLDAAPERTQKLHETAAQLTAGLDEIKVRLLSAVQQRIPAKESSQRGLFLLNSLPFARYAAISWPDDWERPAQSAVIEVAQRNKEKEQLLVKIPPGGFAWLSESPSSQSAHPLMMAARGEAPLAEPLILRNRHFEVTLSDRTGGIASVTWHQQRGNRLSQQSCFRYEREVTLPDDGSGEVRKVSYASATIVGQRVVETGVVFAAVETISELVSPVDGTRLATVIQTTSVDRVQPRIQIHLRLEDIKSSVKGNPWLTYYGCRFAWDNESAVITRAVMGQAGGFRAERFESPDYIEVSDHDHRLMIVSHGRPYHRRSGPRMLDSLLIVEGESAREFQFTIEFDQPFPLRTAADAMTPISVMQTTGTTPSGAASGWILGLSAKNVEIVNTRHKAATDEESESLNLLLSETDGVPVDCLIKTARKPTAAFAINAEMTEKSSLAISDQGTLISLTAFKIREVHLIF
jgi:alpha-mannosidase